MTDLSNLAMPQPRQETLRSKLVGTLAGLMAFAIPFVLYGCKDKKPELQWQLTKTTEAKRYYVDRQGDPFYRVYVDEKPFGSLDYVEVHGTRGGKDVLFPWALNHPYQEDLDYFEKIK